MRQENTVMSTRGLNVLNSVCRFSAMKEKEIIFFQKQHGFATKFINRQTENHFHAKKDFYFTSLLLEL